MALADLVVLGMLASSAIATGRQPIIVIVECNGPVALRALVRSLARLFSDVMRHDYSPLCMEPGWKAHAQPAYRARGDLCTSLVVK
jgi:hypothetical protein